MSSTLSVVDDPRQAQALLHPLRQQLLAELREPDSAAGVARRLNQPRQLINYHLRELEQLGLLVEVEVRQRGNVTERRMQAAANQWAIDPGALGPIAADLGEVKAKRGWEWLVLRAGQLIRDLAGLAKEATRAGKPVTTLLLESDIRFATPASRRQFTEELLRELGKLAGEYHDETAPGGRSYRFVLMAHPAPGESSANDTEAGS